MGRVTSESKQEQLDLRKEPIKKILLVRAIFRMGDSVLAAPAIRLFREKFPHARIDFVGGPISVKLFQNLPIDHQFCITRSFPGSSWAYPILIKQLRAVGYDLAVDLSCSQSAMGSFIVGFSKARFRVGLRGKWDRWFNVRFPRPCERNKYKALQVFLSTMGMKTTHMVPSLILSSLEKEKGKVRIAALDSRGGAACTVGVFVGGRKTWGKRWPLKNFCELITTLYSQGLNVVTFFGPEENDLMGSLSDALDPGIGLVSEPSARDFAALVSNCDLFITCDSGPMHLACALGTPTVAIFQNANFDHWGPPSSVAKIVHEPGGCSVEAVLTACYEELSHRCAALSAAGGEPLVRSSPSDLAPRIRKVAVRLRKSIHAEKQFFLYRCALALFLSALLIGAWVFPATGLLGPETTLEELIDALAVALLSVGGFLRIWAISHAGKCTRKGRIKTARLITTGPYAYIRHPIYLGNFLIGVGLLFLSGQFWLIPLSLALLALQHRLNIPAEEDLLREKLGQEHEFYCCMVPKYIPGLMPGRKLCLGTHSPLNQLATATAIVLVGSLFEWLESPLHRGWVLAVFRWIV